MSIIDALDDNELFAPHFKGESWTAWRAFLAAMFALPMDDEQAGIYRECTSRSTLPTVAFKEAALIVGRRGGKSRMLALIATYLATFRDYSEFLAPGETPTIAIIAADRKQAKVILKYCVGLLRQVAYLEREIADEYAESVELKTGLVIEIHTGSIGSPRGRTFVAVLADEIAFWRSETSVNPDAEVIGAVRPGLASIPGSLLLMASSPYAPRGVLWSTFRRHFGNDSARVLVWRGETAVMNPNIDPAIIAEAYEDDPVAAAAEYGAQFRSDVAEFVSRAVIDAVTVSGRFELPPIPRTEYLAFVDPSGGSSDSMTLAIGHRDDERAILDVVREVKPPFSPEAVVSEFSALLKLYGVSKVKGDRYAGEWPRERFQTYGITYEVSERTKGDIYRNILPSLNSQRVELLDLPKLATQFCNLERRMARGGKDSIDHPPGSHDDLANAAAGVLVSLDFESDESGWLALGRSIKAEREAGTQGHAWAQEQIRIHEQAFAQRKLERETP